MMLIVILPEPRLPDILGHFSFHGLPAVTISCKKAAEISLRFEEFHKI